MILIDKSGERAWCVTHNALHSEKRCPKCVAAQRKSKRKTYERKLYESILALKAERMASFG